MRLWGLWARGNGWSSVYLCKPSDHWHKPPVWCQLHPDPNRYSEWKKQLLKQCRQINKQEILNDRKFPAQSARSGLKDAPWITTPGYVYFIWTVKLFSDWWCNRRVLLPSIHRGAVSSSKCSPIFIFNTCSDVRRMTLFLVCTLSHCTDATGSTTFMPTC